MHLHLASLILIAIVFMAQARTQDNGPAIPEIQLRGGRFTPLTSDQLNAEQRALVERGPLPVAGGRAPSA